MSADVVNFLQWASEPEMEARKTMGMKVMAFLAVMTFVFYLSKRRIWKDLH
jgi:ubiquinol-cytochrome c reductase cytochrome c1 subunit